MPTVPTTWSQAPPPGVQVAPAALHRRHQPTQFEAMGQAAAVPATRSQVTPPGVHVAQAALHQRQQPAQPEAMGQAAAVAAPAAAAAVQATWSQAPPPGVQVAPAALHRWQQSAQTETMGQAAAADSAAAPAVPATWSLVPPPGVRVAQAALHRWKQSVEPQAPGHPAAAEAPEQVALQTAQWPPNEAQSARSNAHEAVRTGWLRGAPTVDAARALGQRAWVASAPSQAHCLGQWLAAPQQPPPPPINMPPSAEVGAPSLWPWSATPINPPLQAVHGTFATSALEATQHGAPASQTAANKTRPHMDQLVPAWEQQLHIVSDTDMSPTTGTFSPADSSSVGTEHHMWQSPFNMRRC